MCVITAYGVQCLGCWLFEVRCRAAGRASGVRDAARMQHPSSWVPVQGCTLPLPYINPQVMQDFYPLIT